jgi:hypothetical protein
MVCVLHLHTTIATYFEMRSGKMISSPYHTRTTTKKLFPNKAKQQYFISATEQPSTIYLH